MSETCDWCGRPIRGRARYTGLGIGPFSKIFCSDRCKREYLAQKNGTNDSYSIDEKSTGSGGCLAVIKKVIKWTIIAIIAIFVILFLIQYNSTH